LCSSGREDPDVRIEFNGDSDAFNAGLGQVVKPMRFKGKEVYADKYNNYLDDNLGMKWIERILNPNDLTKFNEII